MELQEDHIESLKKLKSESGQKVTNLIERKTIDRIENKLEDSNNPMSYLYNQSATAAYKVTDHQGYFEKALPSQYHVSMKVVSQIDPTSLRGIQHVSQKSTQMTRML